MTADSMASEVESTDSSIVAAIAEMRQDLDRLVPHLLAEGFRSRACRQGDPNLADGGGS